MAARGQLIVQVFIGDGDNVGIPFHLPGGQGELGSLGQGNALTAEGADADLGSLGVQNGGHGMAQVVPHMLEAGEQSQMGLVAAVGKIEPGGIHAGKDQLFNDLLAVRRGSQGTDDFRFSHAKNLHSKFERELFSTRIL